MKKKLFFIFLSSLRKKNLHFLCVACIIAGSWFGKVNAQDDPFIRLKQVAQGQPVIKKELSKISISTNSPNWRAITKAPITFKPFTLDSNGVAIPPDRIITLPGGQKITAKEYVDRLNQVERKLNEQGQTLRTNVPVVVSETVTRDELLSGKVANFPRPISELRRGDNLKTFMSPQKQIGGVVLKPISFYTPAEKTAINTYRFNEVAGGISANKAMTTTTTTPTNNNIKRLNRADINNIRVMGPVKPLKVIDETDSKDWNLGDPSTFQAGIQGSLHRYAKIYPFDPQHPDKSMSEFKVSGTGKVYGSLFDNSQDVLTANAEFDAPADTSKKMTAKLQVQTIGITILNLEDSYAQSKDFSDMVGKNFDQSFPIEVPIGWGFDFKGKIGIKGSAGFQYGANLYRTFASVQAKPVADLEGYAEAGIDFLDVIGGGVGGNLTFIKGDLELQVFAGIWSQNADQIVLAISYYFGYDLQMLSGTLYCYVEACAPWIGCYRPVQHNFFSWNGFKQTGTISEGSAAFVLANITQTEQPVLKAQ